VELTDLQFFADHGFSFTARPSRANRQLKPFLVAAHDRCPPNPIRLSAISEQYPAYGQDHRRSRKGEMFRGIDWIAPAMLISWSSNLLTKDLAALGRVLFRRQQMSANQRDVSQGLAAAGAGS
jgi:hypothetical protein